MRAFLCAELLDFAVAERRVASGLDGVGSCDAAACGLGHLRTLAQQVAPALGCESSELLRRFGSALFGTLVRRYPSFFVGIDSTPDLIERFASQLGAEVTKLAPHVQLPPVTVRRRSGRRIEFDCGPPAWSAGLLPLAEGLLAGSIQHFREPHTVEARPPAAPVGSIRFVVRKGDRPRTAAAAAAWGVALPRGASRVARGRPPPRG